MSTNTPQTKEQALASKERNRFNLILTIILVAVFLLTMLANALGVLRPAALDLSNGGFCVKVTNDKEPDIFGIAGAKNCGEAPVTPSVPTPELAVAGVCAAPNAENKIFALTNSGKIYEYIFTPGDRNNTLSNGVLVTDTGIPGNGAVGANSLGLTPKGEFFFQGFDGKIYSHTPGSATRQVSPAPSFGRAVAGASMVYKSQAEHYVGFTKMNGSTALDLTVFRYSPTAERNGIVFTTQMTGVQGANGDFSFAPSGDLRIVAGGTQNRLATIPFSSFADLDARTGAVVENAQSDKAIVTGGGANMALTSVNGVAFVGDYIALSSASLLGMYEQTSDGPQAYGFAKFTVGGSGDPTVDLASCQIN